MFSSSLPTMNRRLLILLLVAVLCISRSVQLKCQQCSLVTCPSAHSLGCKFGVGKDACGCCPVCLKGPGESCGGPFNLSGKCGRHLICKAEDGSIIDTSVSGDNPEGKCVRAKVQKGGYDDRR